MPWQNASAAISLSKTNYVLHSEEIRDFGEPPSGARLREQVLSTARSQLGHHHLLQVKGTEQERNGC